MKGMLIVMMVIVITAIMTFGYLTRKVNYQHVQYFTFAADGQRYKLIGSGRTVRWRKLFNKTKPINLRANTENFYIHVDGNDEIYFDSLFIMEVDKATLIPYGENIYIKTKENGEWSSERP